MLDENRAPLYHFTRSVNAERSTIEYKFVLTADKIDINNRYLAGFRAFSHNRVFPFSPFVYIKRRSVKIEYDLRACGDAILSRSRVPDVLTDSDCSRYSINRYHAGRITGLEVSFFVEYAVVRELPLVIPGNDFTTINHRCRISDKTSIPAGVSDHHTHVMNCVSNGSDTRFGLLQEILAEKQVFGWVTRDRKLGKNYNSAPQHIPRLFAGTDNTLNIAINITEVKIKLSKPDGKCFH